jgi:hypothetical protein
MLEMVNDNTQIWNVSLVFILDNVMKLYKLQLYVSSDQIKWLVCIVHWKEFVEVVITVLSQYIPVLIGENH